MSNPDILCFYSHCLDMAKAFNNHFVILIQRFGQMGKRKRKPGKNTSWWIDYYTFLFLLDDRALGLEMSPDPTRAYFFPAINKRLTWLWPGAYFLIQPDEIFFEPKGKKLNKIAIFRGKFPNPHTNQRWLSRPKPNNKNWTRTHH